MKRVLQAFVFALFVLSLIPNLLWSRSFTIPQANFIITPTVGELDQPITFNASDSFSADGRKNLQYRWKFTPKDDWTNFSSNAIRKFTTGRTGNFRAQLQVKDNVTGITQNTFRNYRVGSPIPRRAHLYVSPLNPQAGEPVEYRVEIFKVRNEDIDDIQVRWDFDGDGKYDTGFSSRKEASSVFGPNQVRSFRPTAEVKFKDGDLFQVDRITPANRTSVSREDFFNSSNTKRTPKIKIRSGLSVYAPILNVSPGSYGSHPETQFIFDATKSRIPRGGWVEWSFDNGPFKKGSLFKRKQFSSSGKHQVRVRTCTGYTHRECAQSQATFLIKERPPQFYVNAFIQTQTNGKINRLQAGSYTGFIGQSAQLSASVQSIDGRSIPGPQYRWDIDGDGKWDTAFSSQSQIKVHFDDAETLKPKVEARSKDGLRAKDDLVIQITKNTDPKADFILRSQKIKDGFLVTFTPKVSDKESNNSDLQTRFDLDGDKKWETSFERPRSISWRYKKEGEYTVQMQVRDRNGSIVTKKALIVVRNPKGDKNNLIADTSSSEKENNDLSLTPQLKVSALKPEQKTSSTLVSPKPLSTENRQLPTVEGEPLSVPEDNTQYLYTENLPQALNNTEYGPLQTPPTFEIHKAFARLIGYESSHTTGSGPIPYGIEPLNGGQRISDNLPITPFVPTINTVSHSNQTNQNNETTKRGESQTPSEKEVSSQIQELQQKYARQSIEPAYPGENPFTDISEEDPYFPYAIQAYRDGLINGPEFYSS